MNAEWWALQGDAVNIPVAHKQRSFAGRKHRLPRQIQEMSCVLQQYGGKEQIVNSEEIKQMRFQNGSLER